MHDGIVGLVLYLVHWLSLGSGDAEIDVNFIKMQESKAAVFMCRLDTKVNRQLEQLIDAGIPLRFKFVNVIDQADTLYFFRSMQFDMVKFTYNWTDSLSGTLSHSQDYSLIHLAMVDFCKWRIEIPDTARQCRIEVTILPSKAEQLDRMVDMSRVWGQQKVTTIFNPQDKINRNGQNERKGR